MENEALVNEYIANLAKTVNDLTLENILIKSKQNNIVKEQNQVVEQVQRQTEEIATLKDAVDVKDNELIDSKRKSRDDDDFIKRLEAGLEQANSIIAQFEEEKNAALGRVRTLEKEALEMPVPAVHDNYDALVEEKNSLYAQNVKLLKELDYTEKKLSEFKTKLAAANANANDIKIEEGVANGNDNQTETVGSSELDTPNW
tara:strand:+ start:269 stop:871 length:603 start_codon:yes stop_codon:yes gene_type:complete